MLTTEAMWSRPMRMPARISPRQPIDGLASCSSQTADVWVTVTSSVIAGDTARPARSRSDGDLRADP
ncbi:hypothetical protein BFF78_37285 [Streptomyces fodineus]|uniref:Uncharacterized protein n=1 Tax=Streptomyces fodineus TaxID=1904616 RepID=A0A1D7YKB7_9ACTN|nr:hypothetical protein BFF78_37285 [Streptomyces fodineus]